MAADNREELQNLVGSSYRLQWVIGHGGMSTVWLADDRVNDREVAIKILRPEFSGNEEFRTRFRNEAVAAEGINSPNVVATYDYREVETEGGFTMCFIVMEYIRGESLADLIAREGKLEEDLALDVLEQASHGLAVIHRMGLVHRDMKPGNLMITQAGQVKVTDFGIAKAAAAVPLTRTGMVVGTAQYVSPEQAQGKRVTAASDVYSLGVVGYEMLSGARPFTGDSSVSVALAHVSSAPPALSTQVSAPARELIEIALRKDPEMRFHDGNEMQLAIAQVRRGLRPAQPKGGPTNQIAVEPSATASTQMLASVAQPNTVRPSPPKRQDSEEKGGFALGLGIAAIIIAVGGALVWALTSGPLAGDSSPRSTRPSIITHTETVEPEVSYSSEVPSRERTTARTEEPGTVTVSDEPPRTSETRDREPSSNTPGQAPSNSTVAPLPSGSPDTGNGQDAPGAPGGDTPTVPDLQIPPLPEIGGN
ncbi:serine/threonine-protein kinase [Corynebacterium mayonis]|uniref:serine/threonine-protein kinase n=1 Tax=Corynebacterium mayonis TaxID=3062461 RepID=UPI003140BF3B